MQQHRFDIIAAAFGALFVWLGVVELIPEISVPASTVWPVLAVGGGVALLASAIRKDDVTEEVEEPDSAASGTEY